MELAAFSLVTPSGEALTQDFRERERQRRLNYPETQCLLTGAGSLLFFFACSQAEPLLPYLLLIDLRTWGWRPLSSTFSTKKGYPCHVQTNNPNTPFFYFIADTCSVGDSGYLPTTTRRSQRQNSPNNSSKPEEQEREIALVFTQKSSLIY